MARPPNVGRINTRISMPSAEKQKELEEKASQVVDPDEGWLQLLSDEDIRTPSDLFRDPPEKLVAKTDDDSLVYGWLIEDRLCCLCFCWPLPFAALLAKQSNRQASHD